MTDAGTTPLPRWRRKVRDEIYDHVFGHLEGEVGGVLVGAPDAEGNTVINAAIPALHADGQRASVTFTHEAWAEVHEVMDRRYSDQKIMGWYHSHPGFGIFLSEHDLFIHRNFFSDLRQVAFVVDPYAGTQGLFGWSDGAVVKLLEGRTNRRPVRPPVQNGTLQRGAHGGALRWRVLSVVFALVVLSGLLLWLVFLSPSGTKATHHRPAPVVRTTRSHPNVRSPNRVTTASTVP